MNCEKCGTVMIGKTELHCPSCNYKSTTGISYESLEAENTQLRQRVEERNKTVAELAKEVEERDQRIRQLEAEVAEKTEFGKELYRRMLGVYGMIPEPDAMPLPEMATQIRLFNCTVAKLPISKELRDKDNIEPYEYPEALSTSTGSAIMAKLEAADKLEMMLKEVLALINHSWDEISCINSIGIGVSLETKLRIEHALSAYRACERDTEKKGQK